MKMMTFPAVAALIATSTLAGCNSSEPASQSPQATSEVKSAEPKVAEPKMTELQVGDVAPAFDLKDQNNALHKLSDSKGRFTVLAFYPADMTGGCTLQAHKMTQALSEFQKRKTQVYGISVQNVASKKEFCDKEGIKYPLLADDAKSAARAYGVLNAGGVANRVTFIVAPGGKIAAIDRKVHPISAATGTLALLDKAQKAG